MPDQDPGLGAGVFVPFFGVLAATSTLIARLVQTTGASMVLAFAERLPSGAGFRLHLRPGSPGIHDPDLLAATASLNCDIEGLVRERPEQYVWSYKRFRIRPPGDPSPY
jgi:KDO2-lipid IV(A) lauroyltransferase